MIEYVDGELHTYDNPIGVITNSPTFDWQQTNLRNYINLSTVNASPLTIDGVTLAPFGQGSGMMGLPGDFTPPSRFVRAVALSQDAVPGQDAEATVKVAFHILDSFDIPLGAVRPPAGSNEPLGVHPMDIGQRFEESQVLFPHLRRPPGSVRESAMSSIWTPRSRR